MSDLSARLGQAHGYALGVVIESPDFDAPIELAATDQWTLDDDETRVPRTTARITVEPFSADIDPRSGARVSLTITYLWPDGTEGAGAELDLALRAVTVSALGLPVIVASSDESLALDASARPPVNYSGTPLALISQLISSVISPRPRLTASVADGASVTLEAVTDTWTAADDLADRLDADLWCDRARLWHIAPRPEIVGAPVYVASTGPAGNATGVDVETTRESGWGNYVSIRYTWSAGDVERHITGTAYILSGPWSVTGPTGKRSIYQTRDVATDQASANAAAAALLKRALTRGRTVTVTGPSAYWVIPGDTVDVDAAGVTAGRFLVSRVAHTGDGMMTLSLRSPELATRARADGAPFGTVTPVGLPPVVDPPPVVTEQTYTTRWVASDSGTYNSSGTQRGDTTDAVQGFYSGSIHGQQRAVIAFTAANSTGDETGRTITQALADAIRVTRVRLTLTNRHWYSAGGGTARIGWAALTSVPSTWTGGAPSVTSTSWRRGAPRTVVLTSSGLAAALLSGACRAVTLGPGVGTDPTYYGRFAGAADPDTAARPVLEIQYTKAS